MLWHLGFNFTRQGAFDLYQKSILRDTICRTTEPWIISMANNTNLMRLVTAPLVIQVAYEGLEKRPVRCGGVSSPLGLQNLLLYKRFWRFVMVLTDGTRHVTRGNHTLPEL